MCILSMAHGANDKEQRVSAAHELFVLLLYAMLMLMLMMMTMMIRYSETLHMQHKCILKRELRPLRYNLLFTRQSHLLMSNVHQRTYLFSFRFVFGSKMKTKKKKTPTTETQTANIRIFCAIVYTFTLHYYNVKRANTKLRIIIICYCVPPRCFASVCHSPCLIQHTHTAHTMCYACIDRLICIRIVAVAHGIALSQRWIWLYFGLTSTRDKQKRNRSFITS